MRNAHCAYRAKRMFYARTHTMHTGTYMKRGLAKRFLHFSKIFRSSPLFFNPLGIRFIFKTQTSSKQQQPTHGGTLTKTKNLHLDLDPISG